MKRVLVTGGAGFIGSHLVDALAAKGCFVRVVDNLVNGRRDNLAAHVEGGRFNFIEGDITDRETMREAMRDIDTVFHCACLGVRHSLLSPFENHRVNAEGTLISLDEALRGRVGRFVYVSSSEVYGTARVAPMTEDHPTHPHTVYGAGKLAGEAYARAYHRTAGLPAVMIRLFNTYGPRSHYEGSAGELIPKSIVRALNGRPILIFGDGSQTRDFTYVGDMADALMKAAQCDGIAGLTFNVGSGLEMSVKQVAQAVIRKSPGGASRIEYCRARPGDVARLCADAALFKTRTGWRPATSFEEGLVRTIEWFTARPEPPSELLKREVGINWERT